MDGERRDNYFFNDHPNAGVRSYDYIYSVMGVISLHRHADVHVLASEGAARETRSVRETARSALERARDASGRADRGPRGAGGSDGVSYVLSE